MYLRHVSLRPNDSFYRESPGVCDHGTWSYVAERLRGSGAQLASHIDRQVDSTLAHITPSQMKVLQNTISIGYNSNYLDLVISTAPLSGDPCVLTPRVADVQNG